MVDDLIQNKKQKQTKIIARISTLVYLVLLPFSVLFAFFASVIDSSPAHVLLQFCTPCSIPVTLYFLWCKHTEKNYKNRYLYCLIPLYVFVATQCGNLAYHCLLNKMSKEGCIGLVTWCRTPLV